MVNYQDKHHNYLPEQPADPQAETWASKNKWFGQNRAMTFTAFEIHKDLVEREGYDPKSNEYYTEIDKRIRVDFPNKFDKDRGIETSKPVQSVASAQRSGKTRTPNCETHIFTGRYCEKIRCATRRICETIKTHEGGISI